MPSQSATDVGSYRAWNVNGSGMRLPAEDHLERLATQNLLNLIFRVGTPRAVAVEPDIGAPMAESFAGLLEFLACECEVVVRVGVSRGKGNSRFVGLGGIGDTAGFVEHVAQIEVAER